MLTKYAQIQMPIQLFTWIIFIINFHQMIRLQKMSVVSRFMPDKQIMMENVCWI